MLHGAAVELHGSVQRAGLRTLQARAACTCVTWPGKAYAGVKAELPFVLLSISKHRSLGSSQMCMDAQQLRPSLHAIQSYALTVIQHTNTSAYMLGGRAGAVF